MEKREGKPGPKTVKLVARVQCGVGSRGIRGDQLAGRSHEKSEKRRTAGEVPVRGREWDVERGRKNGRMESWKAGGWTDRQVHFNDGDWHREARDGDLPNLQRLAPVRSADNAPLRGCRVSPLRADAWAEYAVTVNIERLHEAAFRDLEIETRHPRIQMHGDAST